VRYEEEKSEEYAPFYVKELQLSVTERGFLFIREVQNQLTSHICS